MEQQKNTLKRKNMRQNILLLSILASGCIISTGSAIADNINVTVAPLSISRSTPLTSVLLDKYWNNRENLQNQQAIIAYLQTYPQVPNNYDIAWKVARLVYFSGNYGIGERQFVSTKAGVKLFDYGAKAGELAMKLNPNAVEGYYWYAINLGSYGLANGIIASAIHAKDGMNALKIAMKIDPTYHWYGSSRVLGRYYQELPAIFGGSSAKAEQLFITATQNASKFDNNWVYLGQYYNSKGEYTKGLNVCQKALDIGEPLAGAYEEARYRREANLCINYAHKKLS